MQIGGYVMRKSLIATTTLFLVFFSLSELTVAAGKEKASLKVINKIVIINEYEEVKPLTITSSPATTVIWVNHSRTPVEILFLDKKVTAACGSPVNFFAGKNGAYESGKIPFGGTASLCFLEKGKYNYLITSSRTFYIKQIERENKGFITIE
jgi:plastocyanin